MPESPNQWLAAIAKLTALTQDGKLKWTIVEPGPQVVGRIVGPLYAASHAGRNLQLFQLRGGGFGRFEEESPLALEFVDDEGRSLFTFPELDNLVDLYNAVRYQTAGVKSFLDSLLESD
jgi:hypothetical protein